MLGNDEIYIHYLNILVVYQMSIDNVNIIKLIFSYFKQCELFVYSLEVNNDILMGITNKYDKTEQFFECCRIGWLDAINLIGITDENILEGALQYIVENEELDNLLNKEEDTLDQMMTKVQKVLYRYGDIIDLNPIKIKDNILTIFKNKISKRIDYNNAFKSAIRNRRVNTFKLLKYWFIEDWIFYDKECDFNDKFPIISQISDESIKSGSTECVLKMEDILRRSAGGMGWQGLREDSDFIIPLCGHHGNIEIFEILCKWLGLDIDGLFNMSKIAASLGHHDIIIHGYKKYARTIDFPNISVLIDISSKNNQIETTKALSKLIDKDMGSTPDAYPRCIWIDLCRASKVVYY